MQMLEICCEILTGKMFSLLSLSSDGFSDNDKEEGQVVDKNIFKSQHATAHSMGDSVW